MITAEEIAQSPIRMLSFWQPFGSLMFYNKIETRVWDTPYRGLVLFHTSQRPLDKQTLDKTKHINFTSQNLDDIALAKKIEDKQYHNTFLWNGFIIGIGRLVEVRKSTIKDLTYIEFNHNKPPYAHIYTDVHRIDPIPYKGAQKWGKVDQALRERIVLI
jgi:hypothetical protein